MKLMMATTIVTTLALTPLLAVDNEPAKRLDEAAAVFSEIMGSPDKGIPQDLLQNAHCIVIVPDLKTAALGVAGNTGKGTCPADIRAARAGRPQPRSASREGAWASRSAPRQRT
jgi:lipid-binding SYLF domain-containing protein